MLSQVRLSASTSPLNHDADPPSSGYFKFTSRLAFQTPCFSSFGSNAKTTPPPLTAGLAANPTDSSKPTSAILNIAWAMSYNVTEPPSSGLSQAATIGIGVGAGVLAILLGVLFAFVCLRIRKSKRQQREAETAARIAAAGGGGMGADVGETSYQHGYHQPGPGSPGLPGSPEMGEARYVPTPATTTAQPWTPSTEAGTHGSYGYSDPTPPPGQPYQQGDYYAGGYKAERQQQQQQNFGQELEGTSPPPQEGYGNYNDYSTQVQQQRQSYQQQHQRQFSTELPGHQRQFSTELAGNEGYGGQGQSGGPYYRG